MENKELFTALLKAQGEFPTIPKDSRVDVYSKPPERRFLYTYFYADLTTIINCTRPSLLKHGLGFTQDYDKEKGLFFTRFIHSSGYFDTGHIPFSPDASLDMKTVAGLFTYVKRISLTAALGVSADEDVDAAHDEAALGNSTTRVQHGPKPSSIRHVPPTAEELNALDEALEKDPAPRPPAKRAPKNHAPEAETWDTYKIPFGKYLGRKLTELGVHNCMTYKAWLEDNAKKSGKPLSDGAQKFIDMADAYAAQLVSEGVPKFDASDEMPDFKN